jgi:hypothetical protein
LPFLLPAKYTKFGVDLVKPRDMAPTVFEQLARPVVKKKPPSTKGIVKKPTPPQREVKNALSEAFLEIGGIRALVEWGMDNPEEFYKLWARILPHETREILAQQAKPNSDNNIKIEFVSKNEDGSSHGTRVTIGPTGDEAEGGEDASLPSPSTEIVDGEHSSDTGSL